MKDFHLFAVFVTFVIVSLFLYHSSRGVYSGMDSDNFINVGFQNAPATNYSKPRKILIYTEFFYSGLPWPGLTTTEDFTQFKGQKCSVTNCELTYDKNDSTSSDVVIFRAYNMPSSKEMFPLQLQRPQHQVWVYFHLDSYIDSYIIYCTS